MYNERSNIYNNTDARLMSYYANDEELDMFVSFSRSYKVRRQVADKYGLISAYKIDTGGKNGMVSFMKQMDNCLTVMRTEKNTIQLRYKDTDPERAANVANDMVVAMGQEFFEYYNEMKHSVYQTVSDKIRQEDSTIKVLTDSLVQMRERYQIFDLISPARHNLVSSELSHGNIKGSAIGLETVQNLEAIKDEMVSDRALSITLMHQYERSLRAGQYPLVKVIAPAYPPKLSLWDQPLMLALTSLLFGFFFSTVFCAIRTFMLAD
jgi:uncharacterized protein involved in exopolysaccharide biosynthesis